MPKNAHGCATRVSQIAIPKERNPSRIIARRSLCVLPLAGCLQYFSDLSVGKCQSAFVARVLRRQPQTDPETLPERSLSLVQSLLRLQQVA